jgi:hypothetical protein
MFETMKFRVTYQRKSQVDAYKGATSAPVHTLEVEALNNDEAKRIVARVPGRINILAFPPVKRGPGRPKKRKVPVIRNKPPVGHTPAPFLKTEGGPDADATKANKRARRKAAEAAKAASRPTPGTTPLSEELAEVKDEVGVHTVTPEEDALDLAAEELKDEARIGSAREVVAPQHRPTRICVMHFTAIPFSAPPEPEPETDQAPCCPLDDDHDGNCQIHSAPGIFRQECEPSPVSESQEDEDDNQYTGCGDEELPVDGEPSTGMSLRMCFLLGLFVLGVALVVNNAYLYVIGERTSFAFALGLLITTVLVAIFPHRG